MNESSRHAALRLPGGQIVDYAIRVSSKARSVRLKLGPDGELTVVTPANVDRRRLNALVATKAGWVEKHLLRLQADRRFPPAAVAAPVHSLELLALAESWTVSHRTISRPAVAARTVSQGHIEVTGAVHNIAACHGALRRWVARHAAARLSPWVADLAQSAGLSYRDVVIRNQRTRWGSCSASGRISLNCKLLFLPRELVQYVIWHELCHLLELNHSPRFWAQLRRFEPDTDRLRQRMREVGRYVPAWM